MPDYSSAYDTFLLPDIKNAGDRIVQSHKKQERVAVYGDYDIDVLTATSLLMDALKSFGFDNIEAFISNRIDTWVFRKICVNSFV